MRASRVAPALVAASLCFALPAHAGASMSGAEKLRRLDIMLMVTGLRCRTTRDNFISGYGRFASRQMVSLNRAGAELRGELTRRHGSRGGQRAFDRLNTSMANNYGLGHPWLGCRELKQVARNLANVQGRATLEEAADQLLARRGLSQVAYAKR